MPHCHCCHCSRTPGVRHRLSTITQEQGSPSEAPPCEGSCLRMEAVIAETGQKQVCQKGRPPYYTALYMFPESACTDLPMGCMA